MNIYSLFEDEELANILAQVVKNERPKSDLEKTKWWEFIKLQSFKDKNICDFIQNDWATLNPKFILDTFAFTFYEIQQKPKLHDCLKDIFIDKKLIATIKEEQKEIYLKYNLKMQLSGPTLKPLKVNTKNSGKIDCVAINLDTAHSDTYNFLIDLGENWKSLGLHPTYPDINFTPREAIHCDNQQFPNLSDEENKIRDNELAEVIFLNYPETFNICEKEYYLYICGWNWNFTKGEEHAALLRTQTLD